MIVILTLTINNISVGQGEKFTFQENVLPTGSL